MLGSMNLQFSKHLLLADAVPSMNSDQINLGKVGEEGVASPKPTHPWVYNVMVLIEKSADKKRPQSYYILMLTIRIRLISSFPSHSVVNNPPCNAGANAGDTGSLPSPGGFQQGH